MTTATQTDTAPPAVAFSLDDAVRDILATTGLSDPAAIALELLHRVPSYNQGAALAQALPPYVRQRLAAERALTTPHGARSVLVRSAKVSGITEWWRIVLNDRVSTANGWKTLGECTRADLEYLEKGLRGSAAKLTAKAEHYRRLRECLEEHAPTAQVRSLSKQAIIEVLGTLPDGRDGIDEPDDED